MWKHLDGAMTAHNSWRMAPAASAAARASASRPRSDDEASANGDRSARIQSEKLAAVGLLAAGAMHEINNPVTAIVAYAQLLLKSDLGERQRADVERIATEALRASRIVQNLLSFSRPMRPQKAPLDLNDAVGGALDRRSRQLAADHIAVHTHLCSGLLLVEADRYQLEQVFINIINNARDAMLLQPDDRRLTVSTTAGDGRVRATFDDSGPGIVPADLDRIFDPFFTTKEEGRGTGLGLAVCYGILKEHRGCISAHNLPAGGARFVVELPRATEDEHGG
ncbi:MAG TPA: HAMP domain-containing sensor histidine kinase [Armatimonadota bacterium]|nr:HAMP domain-containing sensor histidine kinase [Armatimonadota bacterium]